MLLNTLYKDGWRSLKQAFFYSLLLSIGTVIGAPSFAKPNLSTNSLDANQNGLDDRLERYLGILESPTLSNNRNFNNRYQAATAALTVTNTTQLNLSAFNTHSIIMVDPDIDRDGDGILDILEVYGYFVDGSRLRGVRRVMPSQHWQNFQQRDAVNGLNVYQWAADALESSGLIIDLDGSNKLIHITESYEAIRNAYLANGLPSTHYLINGSPGDLGTIASIIAEVLTLYPAQTPEISGELARVYFTDHTLRSSDWDPYTDREEVMQDFPAGRPVTPADDPLIGAIPDINTKLNQFTITDIKENRETEGTSTKHTDVVRRSESKSRSHGFSVGFEIEKDFSKNGGFKVKARGSQSNSWSFSKGTTIGEHDAFGTQQSSSVATSENCFAKLQLNVDLENQGSDRAAGILPRWRITIGDALWQTVNGSDELGLGANLAVGENEQLTLLGQAAGDEACLTMSQANFLEQGGTVGLYTGIESAQINFLDQSSGVIVSDGNWSAYQSNFEENLAKITLNVVTTDTVEINRTFWVRAYDENDQLAGMRQSIRQVLEKAYAPIACADIGHPEKLLCLETQYDGYILLGESSDLDFSFFDQFGNALDFEQSYTKFFEVRQQQGLTNTQHLDLALPRRTTLTVTDDASQSPEVTTSQVISNTPDLQESGGIEVRTTVSDFFGVESVYFCKQEFDCELMESAIDDQPAIAQSGYYRLILEDYELHGSEYILATNILGNTTQQSPTQFYLNLIGTLYESVEAHINNLNALDDHLNKLAVINRDNPTLANEIRLYNLTENEVSAAAKYDVLYRLLQTAKDACGYINPVNLDSTTDLLEQRNSCIEALINYQNGIKETPFRIYNPYKLPTKNLLQVTKNNITHTSNNDPRKEMTCTLGDLDVVTGLGVRYRAGINQKIGATVDYRSIERTGVSKPLFRWSELKRKSCGRGGYEKQWIDYKNSLEGDYDTRIKAVVDFGWSVGGGNVNKFCVVYRDFDLLTGNLSDGNGDTCPGNWGGIEAFTNENSRRPDDSPGPAEVLLNDIWFNARYAAAQTTHVRHHGYSFDYQSVADHGLLHGAEYRIKSTSGLYLTSNGIQEASRTLSMEPGNGSDEQVWVVEVTNDREVRLQPKSFDGFLSKPDASGDAGDFVRVTQRDTEDGQKAFYNEHWIVEKQTSGVYVIKSVLAHSAINTMKTLNPSNIGTLRSGAPSTWEFELLNDSQTSTLELSSTLHDVSEFSTLTDLALLDHNFKAVTFAEPFNEQPVVFSAMQTFIGIDTADIRVSDVTQSGFSHRVQEEQSLNEETTHALEDVAALAATPGMIVDVEGNIVGEVGRINAFQNGAFSWQQLTFKQTYQNPVVIMMLNSNNDRDPNHVRIGEVTPTGAEFKINIWMYLRGINNSDYHDNEDIAYAVVEAGSHQLANHTLSAFSAEANNAAWNWTLYPRVFTNPPMVLSQTQDADAENFPGHVTRQKDVGSDGFSLKLQIFEKLDGNTNYSDSLNVGVLLIGD